MALAYSSLDQAIGVAEGYGKPGALPTLANNPGDLVSGPFSTAHGANGSMIAANGQSIATFPDAATGYAAEDALIGANYAGGSIADLAASWLSGSSAKDQTTWANTVAAKLGVDPSTPVSQTAGGSAPAAAPGGSWLDNLGGLGYAPTPADQALIAQGAGGTSGFTWGRVGTFVLGLIVIGAGLFSFKPVQSVVVQGAKAGARAAAL